jgi:hypothetical protein
MAHKDEEVDILYVVRGRLPFIRTGQPTMRILSLEVLAVLKELSHIGWNLSSDGQSVLWRLDIVEKLLEVDRQRQQLLIVSCNDRPIRLSCTWSSRRSGRLRSLPVW